jgi:hypothetical protein
MAEQNFKNHARFDPIFHFFIMPVLLINVVALSIWAYHHRISNAHTGPLAVIVAIALLLLAFKARMYSLKVQDRVIRVEEKLRIASLVSASELIELDSLTIEQYVALRFASNPELPELARRAIREKLTGKQIKQAVVSWRADNYRV